MNFFFILILIKVAESRVAIVGGTTTTISKCPYQLQLEWCDADSNYSNCQLECGAAVLGSRCVLTAGHCVDGLGCDQIRIRAGSSTNGQGIIYYVEEMVVHPEYTVSDEFIPDADIAFIVLTKPFTYTTYVKPIALAKNETIPGDNCTISGWGGLQEDEPPSDTLNIARVKAIDWTECYNLYGEDRISGNMFCAGLPEGGRDACQGDSGGPCVVNGTLAGIISWGNGCGRPEFPGVYTNIKVFRQWITEQQIVYNCF